MSGFSLTWIVGVEQCPNVYKSSILLEPLPQAALFLFSPFFLLLFSFFLFSLPPFSDPPPSSSVFPFQFCSATPSWRDTCIPTNPWPWSWLSIGWTCGSTNQNKPLLSTVGLSCRYTWKATMKSNKKGVSPNVSLAIDRVTIFLWVKPVIPEQRDVVLISCQGIISNHGVTTLFHRPSLVYI